MASPTLVRIRNLSLTTAGTVLAGTAWVLSTAARTLGTAAQAIRPEPSGGEADDWGTDGWTSAEPAGDGQPGGVAEEIREVYEARGRVVEPAAVPVPDPEPAAVPETHVAELAGRPAAEVVRAIENLSTDELRRLLEHESAHKRRKSVLAAIEKAGAAHAPS
jgi:hypothetical protein